MYVPSPYKANICLLLLTAVFFIAPLAANAATTHEVQVLDPRSFSPNNLTIEVGDTVRWINAAGGAQHDVTADDGSFASVTASSFTFERTFNSIAEILYYCTVHSSAASAGGTAQNGRIEVIAAAAVTDISVESVEVDDGAFEAGEDLDVTVALKNNSSEDSGEFNLRIYASEDAEITASDTILQSVLVTNLTAESSNTLELSVSLPAEMSAGDYFIGAISDLDDTDSSNNSNVDETSIYVFTEFDINAGLNDAWYNPLTNGQGFFITVFPDTDRIFLSWFTFDTEQPMEDAMANLGDPNHRWLVALGPYSGNEAVLTVYITSGGLFDTPPDVPLTNVEDGTIILTFKNCNEGTVSYDILSIDSQGEVPIRRIAFDNMPLCNALLRASQQDQEDDPSGQQPDDDDY